MTKPKNESITTGLSWTSAMEIIIAAIEDGTEEGKRLAKEELRDLARKLDAMNEEE